MSLFSKNNKTKPVALNPYLAARQEWNERYGSYISSKNLAWGFAGILSVVAGLAVSGAVYVGSQSKMIPYVVAVDKLGRPVAVGRADKGAKADPRVVKAELGAFFSDAFIVVGDGTAQKSAINRVYSHISNASPAFKVMNEYYTTEKFNPFKRAESQTVNVAIRSVIQTTAETWQVEWTEQLRSRTGENQGIRRMKGAVTIAVVPPRTEKTIMKNPLGIYVQNISWSQQF